MIIDNELFNNLKNGLYDFKGAMDGFGNFKILVFNTKTKKYFCTDAWHDSTEWIELGQFETVNKDLKNVENILKILGYKVI